jgi:hypothetical protein
MFSFNKPAASVKKNRDQKLTFFICVARTANDFDFLELFDNSFITVFRDSAAPSCRAESVI